MGLTPFKNEALLDMNDPQHIEGISKAIADVRANLLGKDWPMRINGQDVTTGQWVERFNPCDTSELVGRVAKATQKEAEDAVQAAKSAFPAWSRTPARARARYLLRAAQVMRARKYELIALETLESGKTWPEADGDVAEAIDFLDFYARRMIDIDGPHPTTPYPGEENRVYWIPLGPCLVIPPWNFPLAILTGTVVAALVTGNTVVMKPSPRSPVMAAVFQGIMRDLQLPKGVLNMIQGDPEEIGDYLVDHKEVRLISFTGSMNVGCRIYERAGKVQPGQRWLKRVIAEMGGKDAMIIDDVCDLDAAADEITKAAFGFQGQKCSACSRVIAHEAIHDALVEKLKVRAEAITIGAADQRESQLAAVVDEGSLEKILNYVEIGNKEGTLVCGGKRAEVSGKTGWYVEPTIFKDIKPEDRLHCEEVFGPVLAVLKAKDFDHAIEIANSTVYSLTGGVFSDRREHLEKARNEFHVGNLYLNRKCTGALVDVQPFGGFNMSGTDDKAGGREHLFRFLQAKTVTERL